MSIIEGRNAEILQSIIDDEPYENTNPYPSRIEQLLMELKEVIEQGGGGATVDQTYSPTSENAQSGKAVAEALETIPSVTVDQTFDPASANAQSGVAVAQALAALPGITVDLLANGVTNTSGVLSDFPSQTTLSQYPLVLLYVFDSSYTDAYTGSLVVPGSLLRAGQKRYNFIFSTVSATFTQIYFNISSTNASISIANQGGNVTWQLFGIK